MIRRRAARFAGLLACATVALGGCADSSATQAPSSPASPSSTDPSSTGLGSGSGSPGPSDLPSTSSTPVVPGGPTTPGVSPTTATTSADDGNLTALQVFTKAVDRAKAATSFRVTGSVPGGTEQVAVDIAGRVDGTNLDVTMTFPSKGVMELLTVGGRSYLKVDQKAASYLGAKNPATVAGKWIAAPPVLTTSFAEVNLSKVISLMGTINRFDPAVEKVSCASGTCYRLTSSGEDPGSALIAADGTFLVQRVQGTGSNASDLAFSQWNAVPVFSAPKPSEVITMPTATVTPVPPTPSVARSAPPTTAR